MSVWVMSIYQGQEVGQCDWLPAANAGNGVGQLLPAWVLPALPFCPDYNEHNASDKS